MGRIEDVLTSFSVEDGEERLWAKLHEIAGQKYGVTSVLYGFAHSRHVAERVGLTKSLYLRYSHPQDYIDCLGANSFLDNDMCAAAIIQDTQPFLWSNDLENATEEQKCQALIDSDFGMDVGVSFSLPFFEGSGIGGLGFCTRGLPVEEFGKIWGERSREMQALVAAFDVCMRPAMVSNRLRLTPRERDVLAYAAAGMGAKEIARRLGLHHKTVFNAMDRARKSLQAGSTMEAIAKAYVYNLI